MIVFELLKAILYGIVEGITEWLPISSTGHLILLEDWLPFAFSSDPAFIDEFWEMFGVVIQLGAILAVVVLFWSRLVPFGKEKTEAQKRSTWRLWGRVLIASVPAALVGIIGDKLLEKLTGTLFFRSASPFVISEKLRTGSRPRRAPHAPDR